MARKNGDVVPHNVPERFRWKCDVPDCNTSGTVTKKSQIKLVLAVHKKLLHGR